jgi:hypothetical protein
VHIVALLEILYNKITGYGRHNFLNSEKTIQRTLVVEFSTFLKDIEEGFRDMISH